MAHVLVYLQAWVGVPLNALSVTPPDETGRPAAATARPQSAEARPPTGHIPTPTVSINRQIPMVVAPSATPVFSEAPTDLEIFRARVFDEPLVPIGASTTTAENAALAEALATYAKVADPEKVEPLREFLTEHPGSAWRAALLTDLGLVYRRTGYFSRALAALEEAWALARGETKPRAKAIADRALSQLAELNGRLGRYERLDRLFAEIDGRDVGGSAGEWLLVVRQGRWMMEHEPGKSFRCGPYALGRIHAFVHASDKLDPRLVAARSTKQGTSLLQMSQLAQEVGLGLQPAKRSPGAHLPLPAVVHWGVGHFAALLEERDGRYRAKDPTFGGEFWVGRAALDAEASGYFLVPEGALPDGWRRVDPAEAGLVWGKGNVETLEPPTPEEPERCPCKGASCPPMAVYGFKLLNVGLRVYDTPVRYSSPRGPSVSLEVDYNQRDVFQPQTFSYANLGPKWTLDWLSYVEDNPATLAADVKLYARGGGQSIYTGMGGGTSQPNSRNQSVLARPASSPIRYERRLPDGSLEVFTAASGVSPRKVFMTSWSDPQGNTLTLTYDGSMRLVALTDALNQVTTLAYESADPLKITRVTDPFGRPARFEYEASGRLARITDTIGITSAFTYDSADFITSLTTPYGTTRFATGGTGIDRWLEATDPLGGEERAEFTQSPVGIPNSEPADQVPTGMDFFNLYLVYRNIFFWDKRAMALHPGDHTKAHIYHWLHALADGEMGVAVLESEKPPLENRVWYTYPNQIPWVEGSASTRIAMDRVLDPDGAGPLPGETQSYRYEYNSLGKVTKSTDPKGRQTTYCYAPNGIDLTEVRQTTGRPAGDPSPCGGTPGTAGINELLASYTYSAQHLPLTTTDAAGQTTTYTYDAHGQVLTVTTPLRAAFPNENRITTYEYDANGYLQSVTAPFPGAVTRYAYDGYGRVRTVTDSDGYAVTTDYDALDRPVRTSYPDGTYDETAYDKLDVSSTRDRLGRWTSMGHDALRRQVWSRDPLGRTITQAWCYCGSLNKLIDGYGNATSWVYDDQGRVKEEVRQNGTKTLYAYEATTSRLRTKTNARQQVTTHTYDTDDNLLTMSHTGPAGTIQTNTLTLTYDTNYNRILTENEDYAASKVYSYHPVLPSPYQLGATQVQSIDDIFGTGDTTAYTYDELGRVKTRTMNNSAVTWAYDELGRVKSETNDLGLFNYTHEGPTARLSTMTYPNGQTTTYAYDTLAADLRLKDIHHKTPAAATLSRFQYTYDAVGNIKTWSQQTGGSPRVWNLAYDLADQLTTARLQAPDGLPMPDSFAYAYDPAGNRTSEQLDAATWTSVYNGMNRLAYQASSGGGLLRGTLNEPGTVTIDGRPAAVVTTTGAAPYPFEGMAVPSTVPLGEATQVQATDASSSTRTNTYQLLIPGMHPSFSYDADGNLTSDNTRTYEWDVLGRLRAVNQGTHRSVFNYLRHDLGQVLEFDNGIETSERLYFWCARERCEERADDFVTVTRRFFEQGFTEGGVKYFYTRDHLGSIREVTDQSGGVRARYDYDPYGRQTKLAGDKDATFAYTGQQTHAPSGLYYYRARYYDPRIGRFLSEDPIGLEGGQNLYGYALNDPIDLSDPLGLLPKSTLGGDDPGFDDPKDMIRQLEEQLKDPDLTQRQREAIRRRIRELQRRPSGKQQHHRSFCGNANPTACGVAMILVAYVCVRRTLLNTVTNTPPPQPPPLPPFVPIVPWWLVLLP